MPSEPITIVNVKIEHEIRVQVDKELDDVFANKMKYLFLKAVGQYQAFRKTDNEEMMVCLRRCSFQG